MSEQWGLLNGHFTGHLLSALAFDAAGTGSKVTAAKSDTLITELAKCQAAYAKAHPEHSGWVSAYGTAHSSKERRRPLLLRPFWTVTELTPGPLLPLAGFQASRRKKQRKNGEKSVKNGRETAV